MGAFISGLQLIWSWLLGVFGQIYLLIMSNPVILASFSLFILRYIFGVFYRIRRRVGGR